MTYAEASVHGGRDDIHMIYEEYSISQYTDGSVLNCLTMTTYRAQDVIDSAVSFAGFPSLGDKYQKAVGADLLRNARKASSEIARLANKLAHPQNCVTEATVEPRPEADNVKHEATMSQDPAHGNTEHKSGRQNVAQTKHKEEVKGNEPIVLDLTSPSVRRAQKRGGSIFRGQVENIIATQVAGLPVGTTFTVVTVPGGAAPLIRFNACPSDTLLTLNSVNGSTVTLGLKASAAVISYVAVNWLLGYHHYACDEVAGITANLNFEALGRYIYRSNKFKKSDIAAIARYTD